MTQLPLASQTDTLYALTSADGVLYAARASGLYHSQDGGTTWQNLFAALEDIPAAVAVAVAGAQIYAGTNGAVLRSDDAGATWQVAALASPPPLVTALALSPDFVQDGVILAATAEDGVFLSDDRGETWVPWNFSLIDKSVYALALSPDFTQDATVFAGTQSGIFVSRNGGRGWHDLPFPEDASPVLCLYVASDGRLYAGTENQGLYASSDTGQSWQRIAEDVLTGGIQAIHAGSIPSQLYVLTDAGLYATTDSGQSWHATAQFDDEVAMALTADVEGWRVGFADGQVIYIDYSIP
jgi:photosystem II stability/assembly factor-like uncharacterized protein